MCHAFYVRLHLKLWPANKIKILTSFIIHRTMTYLRWRRTAIRTGWAWATRTGGRWTCRACRRRCRPPVVASPRGTPRAAPGETPRGLPRAAPHFPSLARRASLAAPASNLKRCWFKFILGTVAHKVVMKYLLAPIFCIINMSSLTAIWPRNRHCLHI